MLRELRSEMGKYAVIAILLIATIGFVSGFLVAGSSMIAAYNEGEEWLEQLKEYLDGNFAYIDAFLKEHLPKAHMVPSEGTYLAWIDFNGYVDGDAEKLEEIMQKKARVALDEGYIFGDAGRGFERINIATPRSVVEDCMDRILKAFKEEKLV